MGPVAIFDKSALQALNIDEAVWFDAFFSANVVPVFYVETLADLEKQVAAGSSPETVVGALAAKTPTNAYPNVHHRDLVLSELAGQPVAMTGQAVINAGKVMRNPDGQLGVHVEQFPEQAALLRWQQHEFLDLEHQIAKDWRAELAAHDPDDQIAALEKISLPTGRSRDRAQLKKFIDEFCQRTNTEVLALAFDALAVPPPYRQSAVHRWLNEGQPPLQRFAPYTAHVFKVELHYYLSMARGFISSERASNKVDMAYLYYLPFAMVFISGDRLHRDNVPLFLRRDQSYLATDELKPALRELDDHYSALPDEIKQRGVLSFAGYPPPDVDNAVTQLWDRHMRRDWRRLAREYESKLPQPRDEETSRSTAAELTARIEAATPVTDPPADAGASDADYFLLTRQVPATKGKWRMVPKDVEDAEPLL